MNILAVDTSTGTCSVAILSQGKIIADVRETELARQAETLLPMIEEALSAAELEYKDMDLLAATTGPGSFTGIRIGMAAMKGIALAIAKPLIGITTLESITWQALDKISKDTKVTSILNAMRNEIYIQNFFVSPSPISFTEKNQASLAPVNEATSFITSDTDLILTNIDHSTGDIWDNMSKSNRNLQIIKVSPEASSVARMAEHKFKDESCNKDFLPFYIRKPDAKLPTK